MAKARHNYNQKLEAGIVNPFRVHEEEDRLHVGSSTGKLLNVRVHMHVHITPWPQHNIEHVIITQNSYGH